MNPAVVSNILRVKGAGVLEKARNLIGADMIKEAQNMFKELQTELKRIKHPENDIFFDNLNRDCEFAQQQFVPQKRPRKPNWKRKVA